MGVHKSSLIIYVTEHRPGGTFYQFEFRGIERWEVLDLLEKMVSDLKAGRGIILNSMRGPKNGTGNN